MGDTLDIDDIRLRLHGAIIGSRIVYFGKTGSTNRDAMRLAGEGAGDGTVVIADEQTGGRGRFDRTWLSPAGKNILMSVILRPQIELTRIFQLTMIASLAVVRAIEDATETRPEIKWPNDVYIQGRKVCGILTEMSVRGEELDFAVVGIGINVNAYPDLDDPRAAPATSLARESGKEVPRSGILLGLLKEMDRLYRLLSLGETSPIVEDWNRRSLIFGKRVMVSDLDGAIEGIAESVDDEGRLILRDGKGSTRKITCGDVTLRL